MMMIINMYNPTPCSLGAEEKNKNKCINVLQWFSKNHREAQKANAKNATCKWASTQKRNKTKYQAFNNSDSRLAE
jgi:hypothetical protein